MQTYPALGLSFLLKLGDDTSLKNACEDIRNIYDAHDIDRIAALPPDTIQQLIALLSRKEVQVQTVALSALRSACLNESVALEAQKHDAIPAVVQLLNSRESRTQESATLLLADICFSSEAARDNALKMKVIPTLVHLITSDDSAIQAAAALALCNINILAPARAASVKAKAIPSLVKLLGSCHADVLKYTCLALKNICWTKTPGGNAALKAGAVEPLARLLSRNEIEVRETALFVLSKICTNFSEAVEVEGCVSGVVKILDSDDTQVQRSAAFLLSDICYESDRGRNLALESDAIPALIRLISPDSAIQAAAAQALVNINLLEEAWEASADAIGPLIELLRSRDDDVVEAACRAINNICLTEGNRRRAAEIDDARLWLEHLRSSHDSAKVRKSAKQALRRIDA